MSDPTFVELEPSGSVGECSSSGSGVVRNGTWNVSWWTAARFVSCCLLEGSAGGVTRDQASPSSGGVSSFLSEAAGFHSPSWARCF